jgi:molecular chaperone GrpE (heat shock protein)
MRDQLEPRVPKWPFFLGDLMFLCAAYFIYFQSKPPMSLWQIAFVVFCVAGGACLGIMPFLLEHRLFLKLTEAKTLTTVAEQMRNLDTVAGQISSATGLWQDVQDEADKTAVAAKGIAERITVEAKAFAEFMQRVNDTEKANLRLEVEKLRRAENDWLHVLVRMLDHVYAINAGALRSGQPNLIEQMGNFQSACRDAARRVGLTPFVAEPSEPFDADRHQALDGDAKPALGALVTETVATGYTFQGRLLRPALVRVRGNNNGETSAPGAALPEPHASQSQVPAEPVSASVS